jgi:Tfp pilus assembly protein PilO
MELNRRELTKALNDFYAKPVARVSLELFLSVATVLFFAVFAIRPTLLTMSDLIKEIEDKRKLDQQLSQKVAALSSAQAEYLRVEEQLGVLDQALPDDPYLMGALKTLEKIASERNIAINFMTVNEVPDKQLTPLPPSQSKRQQLTVAVTLTGDYLSIRQFIEDLKNTRRTFIIDTVIFSISEEQGAKSLKATITLGVPYFGLDS